MAEDNSNLDEKGYSQENEDEKTEDATKGQESEFSQTNNTTTVGGVEGEEDDDDLPFPGFVRTSMFCLSQTNPFRLWCLKVITWPWFERLSMMVILLNCVTLGMYQPCDDDVCLSTRCQVLEKFDHFIFAFFALEMIIKMVAMGVYGESTYLAEAWNKLDMFIVVAGAVEYGVETENLSLSAIRTIRVLRPLRAINRIPSMRILVMLLLDTLPMLGNVLLLCFFVFFIFGIIGVQVWAGVLRSRCFINISENISYAHFNLSPYYMPRVETDDYICSKEYTSGMRFCSNLPRYQYEGIKCNASARPFSNNTPTNDSCVNWNQYYTVCEAGDKNPFQGAISFDNIGLAWVAIFQVISLESWVNIMYYIQDAHSFWDWTYFVSLIVIGSFFMINLCLVVIATQFSETKKRETERMLQERRRFQSSSTLASNSEPGGCYAEILKYLAHLYRRGKRKLLRLYHERTGKNVRKIKPELALRKPKKKGMQENYLVDNMNDKFYPRLSCALSECSYQCPSRDCELGDVEGCQECETEWKIEMEETKKKKKCYQRFQEGIKCLVEHKYFQRGILLAILFNTLSMGIEYHNQPEELTRALETSNIIFSILFAVEMLMKLLAFGPFGYIKNGFNVFDGFIVILSLVELTQQGGASGLSVLRTFRLLRILKLVRFMPALRRQLVVMLRTMDNVATFFALLVLFMFIFSVLGMNVFGGKFCWKEDGSHCTCKEALDIANDCECDRANFNTLLWALVTVFQVLTQEDWNTVLYNGMEKTSPWAALYFVALMTFGNYVLFNLLVAILVEGFSSEEEEKKRMKENKNKMKEEEHLEANNNNEQIKDSLRHLDIESGDIKINNKEKEKMLGLTQAAKEKTVVVCTVPPPIITHTEATPMATPQGSPHEHGMKEPNKSCLAIRQATEMNTLTVEIPIMNTPRASPCLSRASSLRSSSRSSSRSVSFKGSTRLSARVSPRPSPRPSPRLWRSYSYGSRSRNSWKFKRAKDGDKTKLVYNNDTDRDDCIDIDDDENDNDEVFHSNSCLSQKSHDRHQFKSHECNGDIPLNNQRIVRSQNCLLQRRSSSPRNPIRSRNNSSSSAHSVCNSIYLRRQNTFPIRHKCKSLSSAGSGLHSDDYKQNNLSDSGERCESNIPAEEEKKEAEEEDPDAMDEANCSWSWCPEPKGCFKTRNEYSLYIFSPENILRKFSHHVMTQRWFDNTVLFFIALNCITLAMERPDIPPDSPEREFLTYSNYVFTVIFMLEMTIKVLSKGLLIGKHAYLKSGWNIMDGALVVISLVDILITLQAQSSPRIFGILRVFRLLRTLRPLRVISRAPGLKLVVQTLLSSLRPIGNIVLICCTFFIIFGILGVQLFKGTFFYCKGPNIRHVSNKTQCLADRRNVWINQKYNFDDLGQALMALFVLASKDGWVSIMYTGLDAVGVDQQPIVNYSELRLIYFISFLLLVGFFVLNMFVGVVVENFHKCREDQEKEEKARRMAKRVRKLDQKRQKLKQTPYWADYSRSRLLIYTVINSKYFDLAIAGVIGLNVITMAMEYYMMPEELKFALKIFNYFFTSVFILEAVMKVISLGWFRYFRDRWNQLDMLIVVLSIVGIVLEEMETNVIPINPTIIRVMRVLRIARVLKLLKMAKGIRALLDTVIQALPQVGNLGLLFFLLFFIFAALGVELFGRLECSEEHPCDGLSDHAHFKNFGMAFLTLFRVATGDNWNGILKDTLRTDCDDSDNCLNNCCVNPIIAPVYFVVFVLMAQFVLVNVVVAVLMKHLEEMQRMELDEGETEVLLNCNTDSDVQIEITSNDGLSQNTPRNTFPLMPPSLTLRPPSSEPIETDNIPLWEDNQDKYDYNLLNPSSIKLGIMNSSERDTFSSRVGLTLGEVSYHLDIPQITVPELTSIRNRRPALVRQYSQEVSTGSPEQKHSLSPQRKSHSFEETDHEVKSTLHAHSHPLLGKSVNSGVKLQSGIHFLSDPDQMIKDNTQCKSRKSHIFRSASSGTDHSRLKERYQKFPKQHSQNDVSHSNTTINIIKTSISSLKETIGSQCTLSSEQLADDQYTLIDWEEDELFCDEEVKRITGEANEEVDHDEQYPERELNCDVSKDSNFYTRSTCCDNSGFRSFTQDENRLNHRGPELSPGIQHYAAFDNRREKLTLDGRHLSKSDSLTIPGDQSENITLGVDVCKCSSLDDSIQSQAKPQRKDVTESLHVLTSDILTEKKHVFHNRSHVT